MFLIAINVYLTEFKGLPSPVAGIFYMIVTIACYAVLFTYPNIGGVYAATVITASVGLAWFSAMWPWRLQTTSKATGSAFAIAFSNSLGQIGSIIGPQIFRQKYAPRYQTPFGVAMGFSAICLVLTVVTWWVTRKTEKQTREMRKARITAGKNGDAVLRDVNVDADFEKNGLVQRKTSV
jgi:membrane protein implicated in regulation of membrane protease activity